MHIKPDFVCGTLIIKDRNGGYVHSDDRWPSSIKIDHVLRALCGPPDAEGWYPYFEADRRWIASCLDVISNMTTQQIGAAAMHDHCEIDQEDVDRSVVAAASIAVMIFERTFEATREEAQLLVRMNLSEQGVAA